MGPTGRRSAWMPRGWLHSGDAVKAGCPENVELHAMAAHINDAEFCDTALEIFDGWCADGVVKKG